MSRVWFITGSSRGLGRHLAETVLSAGHRLIATARQRGQLDDLAQKYGDQIRIAALDVTDPVAARGAVRLAAHMVVEASRKWSGMYVAGRRGSGL